MKTEIKKTDKSADFTKIWSALYIVLSAIIVFFQQMFFD